MPLDLAVFTLHEMTNEVTMQSSDTLNHQLPHRIPLVPVAKPAVIRATNTHSSYFLPKSALWPVYAVNGPK
jgi:hypothetical protein